LSLSLLLSFVVRHYRGVVVVVVVVVLAPPSSVAV